MMSDDDDEEAATNDSTGVDGDGSLAEDGSTSGGAIDAASKDGWSKPINAAPGFGWHQQGSKGLHKGLDFPAPRGTPVYAAHDGTVTKSWNMGSCGWATVITADGVANIWHAYQHMNPSVKVGDVVKRGQKIGTVGTFCGSGYHLHFSIETANRVSAYADSGARDTSRNPKDYLPL